MSFSFTVCSYHVVLAAATTRSALALSLSDFMQRA